MNYFFLHPSSGKLMYLKEVPEKPDIDPRCNNSNCICQVFWDDYESALKEAKEKAIEVKNQEEFAEILYASVKRTLMRDVIYSLDDSYKVEIEQDMYAYAYDPYNTKFVAIVSVVNQKIK